MFNEYTLLFHDLLLSLIFQHELTYSRQLKCDQLMTALQQAITQWSRNEYVLVYTTPDYGITCT